MSAVADVRGLKRVCAQCGSRFYDMNKRPVICPGCGTEFSLEAKVKGRRSRVSEADAQAEEKIKKQPANDVSDDENEDEDVISLDEAAELEDEDLDDLDELENLDDEDLDDLDAVEDDDD